MERVESRNSSGYGRGGNASVVYEVTTEQELDERKKKTNKRRKRAKNNFPIFSTIKLLNGFLFT